MRNHLWFFGGADQGGSGSGFMTKVLIRNFWADLRSLHPVNAGVFITKSHYSLTSVKMLVQILCVI